MIRGSPVSSHVGEESGLGANSQHSTNPELRFDQQERRMTLEDVEFRFAKIAAKTWTLKRFQCSGRSKTFGRLCFRFGAVVGDVFRPSLRDPHMVGTFRIAYSVHEIIALLRPLRIRPFR